MTDSMLQVNRREKDGKKFLVQINHLLLRLHCFGTQTRFIVYISDA